MLILYPETFAESLQFCDVFCLWTSRYPMSTVSPTDRDVCCPLRSAPLLTDAPALPGGESFSRPCRVSSHVGRRSGRPVRSLHRARDWPFLRKARFHFVEWRLKTPAWREGRSQHLIIAVAAGPHGPPLGHGDRYTPRCSLTCQQSPLERFIACSSDE